MEREGLWRKRSSGAALCGVLAAGALTGCAQVEDAVFERFRAETAHELYHFSLVTAGLDDTALGRDWIAAAAGALASPVRIEPPFQEEGYLPPEEAVALGYLFGVRRGQKVVVEAELQGTEGTRVFLDLFRPAADPARPPQPVASADSTRFHIEHEASRDGDHLLRLQPELLRGGRYRLTVRLGASLAFPVQGLDSRAVASGFGASRDGGRRQHHGVDIFAPRGTPALAAAEGVVARVGESARGGRVVWLRDTARGHSLYYAHLDRQLVEEGQRVVIGDTLGLVGNTGNARTTPPHLHFGIYRRGEGPLDPFPFLHRPPSTPAPLSVAAEAFGGWVRTRSGGVPLRDAPGSSGAVLRELEEAAPLHVTGGSGAWYRVRTPDGVPGFVAARSTEALDPAVGVEALRTPQPVRSAPRPLAPEIERVGAGIELAVLARYEGFLLVAAPGGRRGWLETGDR